MSLGDEDTAHQRQQLQAELEQCRAKTCLVDDLEKENQRLREELAKALRSCSIVADESRARPAENKVGEPRSEHKLAIALSEGAHDKPLVIPREEHDELVVKYKHLNKRFVDMKNAHQTLIAKYRKERENVKVWMQYLEQHNVHLKGSWQKAGISDRPPISSEAELKGQERQDVTAVSLPKELSGSLLMVAEEDTSDTNAVIRSRDISDSEKESRQVISVSRAVNSASGLRRLRSPESTQDEVEDIDRLPADPRHDLQKSETAESESDLPVVVSERALKRKRPTKPDSEAQEILGPQRGTIRDPIKVKSEHGSSSPLALLGLQEITNESLDLDEVGWRVKTPRKRARLQELAMFNQQLSTGELSADDKALREGPQLEYSPLDENSPPALPVNEDDTHEEEVETVEALHTPTVIDTRNLTVSEMIDRPQKTGRSELHCSLLERLTRSRLIIGDRSSAASYDSGKPENTAAQSLASKSAHKTDQDTQYSRAPSEPADAGAPQRHLPQNDNVESRPKKMLEPKSSNMRVLQRSGNRTPGNRGPLQKLPKSGSGKVAAMAEDGDPVTQATPMFRPSSGSGTNKIIGPEQGKSVWKKVEAEQRLGKLLERPTPSKQALRPGQTEPESVSRNRKKDIEGGRSDAPVERETLTPQRLRGRPLHLLELEDFRVNPSYNQGINYAFTETVRNHERRKCLPGCTRPECCGNVFRKSIEIGGLPAVRTSGLRWNSSPPQNEEDALLEEFLGDDRDRIQSLTEEERKELLLQAKTKEFADKHGKHRHAHERRKTPPGFWRTDMPTTQEVEADREEARMMVRTKVEERYREAMRPGGRWIFRDE